MDNSTIRVTRPTHELLRIMAELVRAVATAHLGRQLGSESPSTIGRVAENLRLLLGL